MQTHLIRASRAVHKRTVPQVDLLDLDPIIQLFLHLLPDRQRIGRSMVGSVEHQQMCFFLRLPLCLQDLMSQDLRTLFIGTEPVRVHVSSLDQIVVERGSSFHQRPSDKRAAGTVRRDRQLPRRRFRVKFTLRIDDHAADSTGKDLFTAAQPGEDFIVTAVDAVFSERNCEQEPPSPVSFRVLFQEIHVLHDLCIDPVQCRL